MIRILHIVFSLDPGGMENGLVNVASRLPEDEFAVEVCCLERLGAFSSRLRPGTAVHVLNKPPGKSLPTLLRLAFLIRRRRPDLLHTHDLGPLLHGVPTSFLGRCPQIVHGEHCALSDEERTPHRLRQRRWLYRSCRVIHTVSDSLRDHLLSLDLGRSDYVSIPNGVDTERFQPGDRSVRRQALGIPAEALVLGQIGRLVRHKRQEDLLTVFAALGAGNPHLWLLLVGDGPERDRLEALVGSHPCRERIRLTGHCDAPETLLQAMDLLVNPSLLEGLSNVLLESMACGVPCLTHVACGGKEAIQDGETGYVRDLETVEKLTAALDQLVRSPELLRTIGKQARQDMGNRFSLQVMVEKYAALYRQARGG